MHPSLNIDPVLITPADMGLTLEMTDRCAFALCRKGEFTIKILNESYHVSEGSVFACMPFVNMELIDVAQPSEVICGYIDLKDVPRLINRWINTENLGTIQNYPHIRIDGDALNRLLEVIEAYRFECEQKERQEAPPICRKIEEDLIDYRSKLIIGEVLRIFFAHIPVETTGRTHRDDIFQSFLIKLYSDFQEHRDVRYYADKSGVSLKYFSTVIRQQSGSTPSEWIETVVIGEAKALLRDPNRSIKDIATTLNFPDAPTFTKYFRRVTSLTPRAYRRTLP